VLAAERTGSSDIAAPFPSDRIITSSCGRAASSIHPRYLGDCEETCLLTFDPAPLLPTGEVTDNGLPAAVMPRRTEIELRERDVNKFTALAGADRLVQYLPWFAFMSGQHRHAEPEAGDVACLDPRAVTEDGEFVRVGGCRDRRALSHAASPARQPCGAAYAGTQAHSAGESIVTSDSSVTASAATSGAGTTVVGIVPALPVVFRSNSARQFMFSAGGAGVEATNRAPTGPLLYSGRPETRSAGPAP